MITNDLYNVIEKNYYHQLKTNDFLYIKSLFTSFIIFVEIAYFLNLVNIGVNHNWLVYIEYFTIISLFISLTLILLSFVGMPFKGFTLKALYFPHTHKDKKNDILEYSENLHKWTKNKEKTEREIREYLVKNYLELTEHQNKINDIKRKYIRFANGFLFFATLSFMFLSVYF